jgi:hypothetical protein
VRSLFPRSPAFRRAAVAHPLLSRLSSRFLTPVLPLQALIYLSTLSLGSNSQTRTYIGQRARDTLLDNVLPESVITARRHTKGHVK